MTELKPLMTLLAQAEQERDAALARHQGAQATHDAATRQAEQLLVYRRDYEQRWNEQFRQSGAIEVLHCYQGFMQRLSAAVEQQARATQQAAVQVERAQAAVREHELRVASVRKLIERRVDEHRRLGERLDQKRSDEFAMRASRNRPAFGQPTTY